MNKRNSHHRFLICSMAVLVLFTSLTGCRKNATILPNTTEIITKTPISVTTAENQMSNQNNESASIARSTLVVDYIFYSEDPNAQYDIPLTFSRNGKTYEYTGEAEYSVSEPLEGIAQYEEVTVEEQEQVNQTFLFTSPETGQTYPLKRSTIQFSEEIPVEITLSARVDFGPAKETPQIPQTKEIEYYNKMTKQDETAIAPLSFVENSGAYWLEADEPIHGTFYTDKYDSGYWTIGWEEDEKNSTPEHTEYIPCKVPVDLRYSEHPSWEGYEDDVIKWLNLDPSFYRITGAGWESDVYEKTEFQEDWNREIVVAYRDAIYPYEVYVQDYSAAYETSVQTLGYEAKVWYFADEEDLRKNARQKGKKNFEENIKTDIHTLYQITVSATYRHEGFLEESPKAADSNMLSRPSYTPLPDIPSRLDELKELNSDVYGIIQIPDTVLDHPLMQCAEEESFYLRRNLAGEKDISGLPFLTLDSALNAPGSNSIIYGHNIHTRKKDVFCDLVGYEDLDYYLEHPVIHIATGDGCDDYVIFAYYLVDITDSDHLFPYWNTTSFRSVSEFLTYMAEVKKRNWLDVPIDLTRSDSYITLSSCSLEQNASKKTTRMVVMARKAREGENYENKIKKATKAKTPLLPSYLSK